MHRLLPSVIKDLKKENEILKSEVKIQKDVTNEKNQQIMDLRSQVCHNLQEIASIGMQLKRCIINAMKLRDMKRYVMQFMYLALHWKQGQRKSNENVGKKGPKNYLEAQLKVKEAT